MKMPNSKPVNQKGFTLIEMLLVLGITVTVTLMALFNRTTDVEQAKARETGMLLFEYNNAARGWISNNIGAANANQVGTAWLKSTTCGGTGTVGYLRCDFPLATASAPLVYGGISLSASITTTTVNGVVMTKVTTETSAFKVDNQVRSDLSGIAALTAAAGSVSSATPSVVGTDASFKSNASTSLITMVASNAQNLDAWIRTDGSNNMLANLTFNAQSTAQSRQIVGASRIQSLATDTLFLGAEGGAGAGYQMVVDADKNMLGTQTVSNQRGLVSSLVALKGNIVATTGSVTATANVTAGVDATAGANVVAGAAMQATAFYDANNTNYQVRPSSQSYLNTLSLDSTAIVSGRATFQEMIDLANAATVGAGCSPNGMVSRNVSGQLLNCTNGAWQTLSGFTGSYTNEITATGAFTSVNDSDNPLFINAGGGAGNSSTSNGCYAQYCGNSCQLTAVVGSMQVAMHSDNDTTGAKSCEIEFWVPAHTAYTITSAPYSNPYGGGFTVVFFTQQ